MKDEVHIVALVDGYGFTFEEVACDKMMDVIVVEDTYNAIMNFLNVNDRINNVLIVKQSSINND